MWVAGTWPPPGSEQRLSGLRPRSWPLPGGAQDSLAPPRQHVGAAHRDTQGIPESPSAGVGGPPPLMPAKQGCEGNPSSRPCLRVRAVSRRGCLHQLRRQFPSSSPHTHTLLPVPPPRHSAAQCFCSSFRDGRWFRFGGGGVTYCFGALVV